ncbi:hypothetical protein SLA2020_116320 [Shorea laevis]
MDFIGSLNHEEAEAAQQINCIAFSPTGRFLVSGSYFLTLWDMCSYKKETILPKTQLSMTDQSSMTQVTVMTDERKILFSLSNGEVFVAHVDSNGSGITKLGSHLEAVSGLIRNISNPDEGYSCGDDGFINHFDIRERDYNSLLKCYRFDNSPSRKLKLNGILQNPDDPQCITVCGDDAYIRVYDLRWLKGPDCLTDVYLPHDLVNRSSACIKGIAYSNMGQLLASCNNQKIYMFEQEIGLGPPPIPLPLHINAFPLQLSEAQVYQGHTVNDQRGRHDITFFGPKDEYIASGSACGRIFFWNKREPHRVGSTESHLHSISCMTRHPRSQTPILATSGEDQHVRFWASKLLIG